jgi:hypothetical protein
MIGVVALIRAEFPERGESSVEIAIKRDCDVRCPERGHNFEAGLQQRRYGQDNEKRKSFELIGR